MFKAVNRAVRYRCDLSASLEVGGAAHAARIVDLSRTGAFVATAADIQIGDRGRLAIPLPGGEPLGVGVRVVRLGRSQLEIRHPRVENVTVSRAGAGLTFDRLAADEANRLGGYLELLDER